MFYDRYAELCEKVGITPSRAALEIGVNKSSVTYWKNKGATPTPEILSKIEEYFNVDLSAWGAVHYESDEPEKDAPDAVARPKPLARNTDTSDVKTIPLDGDYDSGKALSYLTRVLEQEFRIAYPELLAPRETLGQRIYRLRRERKISIDDIAYTVGADRETFEAWENDKLPIRKYRLQKIANALGVYVETLSPSNLSDGDALTREGVFSVINTLKERSDVLSLLAVARQTSEEDVEAAIRLLKSFGL